MNWRSLSSPVGFSITHAVSCTAMIARIVALTISSEEGKSRGAVVLAGL